MASKDVIVRIAPYHYIHVLDTQSNITRVIEGPSTFIRQDNEKVLMEPKRMVTLPPRHYCVIENPVLRTEDGQVQTDASGAAKLRHCDSEIRSPLDFPEPFALYPGEKLAKNVTPLQIVPADSALKLTALRTFVDSRGNTRQAGDEWLFRGPGTYMPRIEVAVESTICATVIMPNTALRIRSRKECVSSDGKKRVTGEEWLVNTVGAYLPGVYEEVLSVVSAYVLTEQRALHVQAQSNFTDNQGRERKTGEEWLITMNDCETHIPSVDEKVLGVIDITTLNNRQFCVICNPCDEDGRPNFGARKLVKGPVSFFLQPEEQLEAGIQDVYVLGEFEGVILKAMETFTDGDVVRSSGDLWMIRGPNEYVPPVEVSIVARRTAIPLNDNEGIYVRDCKSGKVRAVIGKTYMLNENEELWSKDLSPAVEELLSKNHDALADRGRGGKGSAASKRDKTRVVTLRVPHNAAVQIYDYTEKKARVVFGPDLVMLGPDEQFTQLSLSGGKPKKPNQLRALCLLMGPDFCTDVITIETSDHARLSLQLSYNWQFVVDKTDPKQAAMLFSVPDFVGDLCKAVASRVRGAVAGVKFDDFHRNSAKIIRTSVFGYDEDGQPRDQLLFPANCLQITSVDIQSAEPVDQRTRDALQKSVQLAIEITTSSQEATARHEAERLEQEAKGRLERQRIKDEAGAENARQELYQLQAQCAAVESTGQAKAEAQSRAEAARIEGEAAVEQARLKAQAAKIEAESELERLEAAREAEIRYSKEQNAMEVAKSKEVTALEVQRFQLMVEAIGADTLKSMAIAGPEMQVKLLQGLGLQSTLITDGSTPINLFNTAQGLVGQMQQSSS